VYVLPVVPVVKAEQWPREETKKAAFSLFSPHRSEAIQAAGAVSEDAPQFSGKAFVDLLLKIKW
jgi:hypothetical protein